VKLVVRDAESPALRAFLANHRRRFASRVAQVEVARALTRAGLSADRVTDAFRGVEVIELGAAVADRAARIGPGSLRALDAIHLASAAMVADEIAALVTYDARLAAAADDLERTTPLAYGARAAGLAVVQPR
jgi:predicted nucleic acid-binding protein